MDRPGRQICDSDARPRRLDSSGKDGDVGLVEGGKVVRVLGQVDGRGDD